jgi:hypothetical protein
MALCHNGEHCQPLPLVTTPSTQRRSHHGRGHHQQTMTNTRHYHYHWRWHHLLLTLTLMVMLSSWSPVYVYAWNNSVPASYRTTGIIQTIVTSTSSPFHAPEGLAADYQRNIYIADTAAHAIYFMPTRGVAADVVFLLAGTSGTSGTRDGSGAYAQFSKPKGLAVYNVTATQSLLYVADTDNHRIRLCNITFDISTGLPLTVNVITIGGSTQGYSGGSLSAAKFFYPWSITIARGGLVIADSYNQIIRWVPLIPTNVTLQRAAIITILVGSVGSGSMIDGNQLTAQCYYPTGVTSCPDGTIWWVEYHALRRLSLTNITTTVLGSSVAGYVEGGPSVAMFNSPSDAVCDSRGQLYVSDSTNQRIRVINMTDYVTHTTAGNGNVGILDGAPATSMLSNPTALAIYPSPSLNTFLYIADTDNNVIRGQSAVCWNECKNNGNCTRSGQCVCAPGFQGSDCSAGICTTVNCAASKFT